MCLLCVFVCVCSRFCGVGSLVFAFVYSVSVFSSMFCVSVWFRFCNDCVLVFVLLASC